MYCGRVLNEPFSTKICLSGDLIRSLSSKYKTLEIADKDYTTTDINVYMLSLLYAKYFVKYYKSISTNKFIILVGLFRFFASVPDSRLFSL